MEILRHNTSEAMCYIYCLDFIVDYKYWCKMYVIFISTRFACLFLLYYIL